MFLTTHLLKYRIEYPKNFVYHFELSDSEFDYKAKLVDTNVCMVYLPKLYERLRSLHVSEEDILTLTQEALNPP